MRPTVLLFDIDGTLISTGGAGSRAIQRAFETHFGSGEFFKTFPFAGMTDRAIVRAGLRALQQTTEEAIIDGVLATYVALLEEEIARSPGYRIHEGILPALEAVASRKEFAVGLGTGNILDGARVKLTRGGIYQRFAFGGFGSDHEDRAELIRTGAERGARVLGQPREACRVVVIGDTPKDIAAAKAIGAECIAVGTGPFAPAQLASHGPSWVFGNLLDRGAIEALLGQAPTTVR